jgi:hypothetical protein
MRPWLKIDQLIFINQVAQGVHSISELMTWYDGLTPEYQLVTIKALRDMIFNARPEPEDASEAITRSGLKPTFTPCVLLAKGASREQINKIADLPKAEQGKALLLLLSLFQVADRRRRSQEVGDVERHWWHRDLGDPKIVREIHELYEAGQL